MFTILLSFSPLFPRNLQVPFCKSTSSMVYGPVHWSSILCPFFVFWSILRRRTASPFFNVQSKPPFLFKNCFFCFSCAASMFPCTLGKSASLVAVICCTCSWRTSSEFNSLASFSISLGSLSTCFTYFWTSRGKRGCLPYIK